VGERQIERWFADQQARKARWGAPADSAEPAHAKHNHRIVRSVEIEPMRNRFHAADIAASANRIRYRLRATIKHEEAGHATPEEEFCFTR
jgi:hypothetical protein